MKKITKIIIMNLALLLSLVSLSFATLTMDNLYFDPAIISAGDNVNIVIEYSAINLDTDKIGDPDYTFGVKISPDDDLTRKYVRILDSQGDNLKGSILGGEKYNKVFRVKVDTRAPAGNYEFKLVGQWYKNGIPESIVKDIKFFMTVKKEGIILNVANINTNPSQVRPGDKYVEVKTFIENVGSKDSKSVEVKLTPNSNLISSTYTDNNRKFVGGLKAGESKEVSFYLNVDEATKPQLYNLNFSMNYLDLEDNSYSKSVQVPFLVKGRSYIQVVNYSGNGLAGNNGQLKVTIKNTGTQNAEAVDVRILKESSQPFNFDVRSNYIGELKPNETGVAIFNFGISDKAEIKTHDFKLLIRTKGDTDEGDDTIYTYNRRAQFKVTGVAENNYVKYGGIGLLILIVYFIGSKFFSRKKKSKK